MENKINFNPDEYVRLFEFKNYPLFYDSLWLEYYNNEKAICINTNNIRTSYIPKSTFLDSLKRGKELYANPEKLSDFIKEFNKVESELLDISKRLVNDFSLLIKFKEVIREWFQYYSYTDFHCTDDAQKELDENFPDFGKYKENKRATINKVGVGEEAYIMKFFKNYAKEKNIPFKDALLYTIDELIENKRVDVSERSNHVIFYDNNNLRIITGSGALDIASNFRTSELNKGKIANKGFKVGRAFILHNDISFTSQNKNIIKEMQEGDIFITETTSPEMIMFCKKASAIVTNQGGIMSHAATVSREFNIPCIVGLDNATRYFHTGDLIEVNANTGTVKILERANHS